MYHFEFRSSGLGFWASDLGLFEQLGFCSRQLTVYGLRIAIKD